MHRHLVQPLPLLAVLATVLFTSCGGPEPPLEPATVYSSRGMVRQLPKAPRAGAEVRILHEDMPDFRSQTGEVVGMESMSMPFPVAGPEMLEGLAVGDRIEFRFEVRWEGRGSPLLLTHVEKLPLGTRLEFENAPEEPGDGETAPQSVEDTPIATEPDGSPGA